MFEGLTPLETVSLYTLGAIIEFGLFYAGRMYGQLEYEKDEKHVDKDEQEVANQIVDSRTEHMIKILRELEPLLDDDEGDEGKN